MVSSKFPRSESEMSAFSKGDEQKLPTIGRGVEIDNNEVMMSANSPIPKSFSPGKTFLKTGTMTNFYFK